MNSAVTTISLLVCSVSLAAACSLLGCSGDTTESVFAGDTAGNGGATGEGGASADGGATSNGGASAEGGGTSNGGASAEGGAAGAPASGGAAGAAGSTSTGGAAGASGATGTGGSSGDPLLDKFSFFVISLEAIKQAGGSEGLGGNLGGLSGADALCQKAAEKVGSTGKTWHAFLSVTNDGNGNPVNAIDRIGTGPWYNRKGLLVANNIAGLQKLRPDGSTDVVYNDGFQNWPFNQCLTDEYGACVLSYGDSHDTLTGSNAQGKLYSSDKRYTCGDWTSTSNSGMSPAIGHAWPRHLNSTQAGEASWVYTPNHFPQGCGKNINLSNTMEQGIGGDGGYGGFYCFAVTGQ